MMTDTERPVVTVWRWCSPKQNRADTETNSRVLVHARRPADRENDVLYEMHIPRADLEPGDEPDTFFVLWGDAQRWPYQVIAK